MDMKLMAEMQQLTAEIDSLVIDRLSEFDMRGLLVIAKHLRDDPDSTLDALRRKWPNDIVRMVAVHFWKEMLRRGEVLVMEGTP